MKNKGALVRRYNQYDKILGANLRANRIQLHYSQGALANKIGVSSQQLQKYERGENRISCSTLYAISRQLDVPIMAFFQSLELDSKPFTNIYTRQEALFLELFKSLDTQPRKMVLDVMKALSPSKNSSTIG